VRQRVMLCVRSGRGECRKSAEERTTLSPARSLLFVFPRREHQVAAACLALQRHADACPFFFFFFFAAFCRFFSFDAAFSVLPLAQHAAGLSRYYATSFLILFAIAPATTTRRRDPTPPDALPSR